MLRERQTRERRGDGAGDRHARRADVPRGRQRGRTRSRPPLSREQVVHAALAIVDRDGLNGFSMRKLGAELGVDPMAAYYYFPNKAAVLDGIVDAVYAEIALPTDARAPWEIRLRAMMHAHRQALRAHPHALAVLSTHPSFSESVLAQWEAACALLHDAGLAPLDALESVGVMAAYVIGEALAEVGQQPGGVTDPSEEDLAAWIAHLPADKFPVLTAALRDHLAPHDIDAQFDRGLDLLIAGIKVRLDEATAGAAAAPARSARTPRSVA